MPRAMGRHATGTLLGIGFWKERLADDFPLPMETEGELDGAVREALIAWLDAGAVVEQYRGVSFCRYGCEGPLGSADLSDGVWVWPEGYSHYLLYHRVVPPQAFVAHVLSGAPRPGGMERGLPVDTRYWTSWAAPLRTASVANALNRAAVEATSRCDEALDGLAREYEAARGISEVPCVSAGCPGKALVGGAFCARCAAEDRRNLELRWAEHSVLRELAAGGRSPTASARCRVTP